MPLAIIVVVLLVALGTALLSLGLQGQVLGIRAGEAISARAAADAALTKAIFEMNEKLKVKPWSDSVLPNGTDMTLPNFDATFDYAVTGDATTGYAVQTSGKSGNILRTIDSTLRLRTPFEFAIFAKDGLDLKSSTTVDWYNYEANDWNMQIGTNSIASGAITLKSGSMINGDVLVGPGGDPDVVVSQTDGVTITGTMYPMVEKFDLPPIVVPEAVQNLPFKGTINNSVTISSSARYDGINLLGNGKIITIVEPVTLYVTGDIILGNSAELRIGGPDDTDNDASLILFLAGNISGNNSSGFNNLTKNAKNLTLYCLNSCQSAIFKNSSDFYGAVYAPEAYVEMKNSADVYGSVIAEQFVMKNSAVFHYDAALRKITLDDEAIRFVIKRWNEQ